MLLGLRFYLSTRKSGMNADSRHRNSRSVLRYFLGESVGVDTVSVTLLLGGFGDIRGQKHLSWVGVFLGWNGFEWSYPGKVAFA